MIVRVAHALKQDVDRVASAPFAKTAWTLWHLLEIERQEELQRDAEDLRSASRVSMAFNDPKALGGEQRALLAKANSTVAATSIEDARARGMALAERIAKAGVMLA